MPYFVQYCVVEKCRTPLSFKIYLFVNNVIFMKMIGKLSSFFSPHLLLMVYFDDVLHNRQAPPPQYSCVQRLNLTAELILSSWNKVIVYAHANFTFFKLLLLLLCILVSFQSACKALLPPFLMSFLKPATFCRWKWKNNQIFLYFNSS